jgi:hypothetical protein
VNNNKGFVHKEVGPLGKGGIHVPHSISRPGVVPGPTRNASPTRNAIGVVRDPNAGARRMSTTPFRGADGAQGPAAVTRSGTYSSGIRTPGGAPVMGGAGSGISTGAGRMGRPIGTPGSASISGTGMAHGGLRVGQIGGPAKSSGGISGASVRAKRP